jgi:hypothetical protein
MLAAAALVAFQRILTFELTMLPSLSPALKLKTRPLALLRADIRELLARRRLQCRGHAPHAKNLNGQPYAPPTTHEQKYQPNFFLSVFIENLK